MIIVRSRPIVPVVVLENIIGTIIICLNSAQIIPNEDVPSHNSIFTIGIQVDSIIRAIGDGIAQYGIIAGGRQKDALICVIGYDIAPNDIIITGGR